MADIIMSGLGGQGVLTAGKILINIAAAEGKNVSWTSTYGAAMRGGSATSLSPMKKSAVPILPSMISSLP